ncbi:MAG TPA: hypothetical protein VKE69_01815 [Planctomycetota bacterium]|nr:hypothetical protein [Planctomycetota bacterium]
MGRWPRFLAAAPAAFAAACAAAPGPPFAAPPIAVETHQFAGSPLGGAARAEAAVDADSDRALALAIDLTWLEHFPSAELSPLTQRLRVVSASGSGAPIQPAARLGARARVGAGGDAVAFLEERSEGRLGRSIEVASWRGALPAGVTTAVRVDALDEGQATLGGHVVIEISRREADRLEVALAMEGAVETDRDDDDRPAAPSFGRARESAVLDLAPEIDGGPLVLVLPRPPGRGPGALVAAIVAGVAPVEGDARAAHDEATKRCLADVAQARATATERAATLTAPEARRRELGQAARALKEARTRRAALVYLTSDAPRSLAADVALAADAPTLEAVAADAVAAAADETALAWQLEVASYRRLAQLAKDSKLPPELEALLLRHAGEATRTPGFLESAVADSAGPEALLERIAQENRFALEDSSPAARVRAYDWLAARDQAPPGYDPLGPVAARREALARWEETR